MSTTLDSFFPGPHAVPKSTEVEPRDRCSNPKCRRELSPKEPKYTLRIKGKESVYCQPCAKAILHPQENTEENL